jgi:tetratricopeptide (TPR) repeat protein
MMKKKTAGLLLAMALAGAGLYAQGIPITESMGTYKDPAERAADAYSRAARAKAKAEKETDPAKKAKLYARAKKDLYKSIGYQENYDALLALGQIQLALGEKLAALDACTKAQTLKPGDPVAQLCRQEATGKQQDTIARGHSG